MLHRVLIFLFFCMASGGLKAQMTISGQVHHPDGMPVAFANVLLLSRQDSVLMKGALSNEEGHFTLEAPSAGTYLVRVLMLGHKEVVAGPYTVSSSSSTLDAGILILMEDALLMQEVQVVAEKPMFEQHIDRTVVNVANVASASGISALDVLERSPGIIVSRQNNSISMSGKEGVVVMINGRINYMPMDAVIQLLAGMSSDNIEKIELITTPPAKYDAEGNAGFINIVLKKNPAEGWAGSYNFSAGHGKGFRGVSGINSTFLKGKWALSGDYNYLYNNVEQIMKFYRRIQLHSDEVITDTRSDRSPVRNNHNLRLGVDFAPGPATLISAQMSAYDTKWDMSAVNRASIVRNAMVDTLIMVDAVELNQWKHLGGSLRLDHTFPDRLNLSLETGYLWYKDNNPTQYHNVYSDGLGNLLSSDQTRAGKLTPITISVSQLDLTAPWGDKTKWEAGAKATFSTFSNDVRVDYNEGQGWYTDPELSALYDLEEYVLAGYASMEHKLTDKTSVKVGLRYEYTDSQLGSIEEPGIVDRSFGSLFPTGYVSHTFSDKYSVNVAYSRRITRPTFNDLAPFLIFVDPSTYYIGNPALQPALSHNVDLTLRLNRLQVGLNFNQADSAIARYQNSIVPGTNRSAWFSENLHLTRVYSMSLTLPVDATRSWRMYYSLVGSWNHAEKYIEGDLTTFDAGNLNFFSSQSLKLSGTMLVELSGFVNTGGLFGINSSLPFGALNAAVQKKFGTTGGTLRIGYDDIFNTQIWKSETDLTSVNQYYSSSLQFSRPAVKVTYSRSFGNQKIKARARRNSAADEERKRVTE